MPDALNMIAESDWGDPQSDDTELDVASINRLTAAIVDDILPALDRLTERRALDQESLERYQREKKSTGLDLSNDVSDLVEILLSQKDYSNAVAHLEQLRVRSVPINALFADVLAPAARQLGEMWERDECSFVDVTVGVSHLQKLVRDFGPLQVPASRLPSQTGSALIAAASGNQHTFGVSLIGEGFRRAGWTVYEAPQHSSEELASLLKSRSFDVIGFSLGCEEQAESLKSDVQITKSLVDKDHTLIVCGGAAFVQNKSLGKAFEVDEVISDLEEALAVSAAFLERKMDRAGASDLKTTTDD